jgi:hypothetical protein
MDRGILLKQCRKLLKAYHDGSLGNCRMPEDTNPGFSESEAEERLSYFTLPMSLNYQRDSYKLWEAALKTFQDIETKPVFVIKQAASLSESELKEKLLKYKLALQPNKHIGTWRTITKTIFENWETMGNLFKAAGNDFLKLKNLIQEKHKKGFPYLSGPKIFNYWSFIASTYGKVPMANRQFIEIAPDTHITKCSVSLGVIDEEEAEKLSKDKISEKWREVLAGTEINPIDMHPPLWFWSRNNFNFKI